MSTTTQLFTNRKEAGLLLAARLQRFKNSPRTLVLALPRGGVEVGVMLSNQLHLPLEVFLARKLGFLNDPEFAMGAVTEMGYIWLNPEIFPHGHQKEFTYQPDLDEEILRQQQEITRQQALYRKGKTLKPLAGYTIILVDDGVATGSTFIASLHSLRACGITRLIAAIPVAAQETISHIRPLVDELEILEMPEAFFAVGNHYQTFPQVEDQQVLNCLSTAHKGSPDSMQKSRFEQKGQQRSIHDFQSILSPEFVTRLLFGRGRG